MHKKPDEHRRPHGSTASAASAFGDLLREYRVRAGLSQSDLAEKAGISTAAVGALERGTRRTPYQITVSLIAKALNLNARDSAALEAARLAERRWLKHEVAHNLPSSRTSFVGRDGDIAQIMKLLDRSRLVTVTGPGGIGKTRISLEIARRVLGSSWDEAWFIDFAPLSDGDLIAAKIAQTLQPPLSECADLSALASRIAERLMLLIFDNCEQIIAQAAQAADALLEQCPHLTILATSRERLNVAGEFVYRLPSLSLPPNIDEGTDRARTYTAIDLFIQRTEAADARISFDSNNLPTVVDIARRLDGVPLAIELTAAQVPVLGLRTVNARLQEHFNLPPGRRDLPARQQTVAATIQWSYDLLHTDERALLSDISIFAGGFSLSGAEALCERDTLDRSDIVTCLSALVNKSLVNLDDLTDCARYSLLDSVRAFGLERLREADRYTSVARRHAQWLAALADDIESKYAELPPERAVELLRDFDNIRTAIAWSLSAASQNDRALAGHILVGLYDVWTIIGQFREHRQLVETALASIDESCHPLVVSSLLRTLIIHAKYERTALDAIERAVRLCEKSGNQFALAKLHIVLTDVFARHGMFSDAENSADCASKLLAAERMHESMFHVALLVNRAQLRTQQGRLDDARADIAAAEATALAIGDRRFVINYIYIHRAEIEYAAGDKLLALEFAQRMTDNEFACEEPVAVMAYNRIACLQLLLGDVDGAMQALRQLLLHTRGNELFTCPELEYAALALALRGNGLAAARTLGCVRVLEERMHVRRSAARQDAYELLCSMLKQQLSDEAIAIATADGARLTPEEAIAEALGALDSDPNTKSAD